MFAISVVHQRIILADQLWYWSHWCFVVLCHYSTVCFLWNPHNGHPVTLPWGSIFLHLYEFMNRVVPKNCAQRCCAFLLLGTEELTHILHDAITGHLTITHWLIFYWGEFSLKVLQTNKHNSAAPGRSHIKFVGNQHISLPDIGMTISWREKQRDLMKLSLSRGQYQVAMAFVNNI